MKDMFGRVYLPVMERRDIPAMSKCIYAYLAAKAGARDTCYPSIKRICGDLVLSRPTVTKYLAYLLEAGVVRKEQRYTDGKQASNLYHLVQPDDLDTAKNQTSESFTLSKKPTSESFTSSKNLTSKALTTKENNIKEKYILSSSTRQDIEEIISYLNEKAGTSYRAGTKATQQHVHARLNEGFTVEDFKRVIDDKCADWGKDPRMAKYLRPETLFGAKFESYLQAAETTRRAKEAEDDTPVFFTEGGLFF